MSSQLPFILLRAASAVVSEIHDALAHDHPDLRPAHGVVLDHVSGGGATVARLSAELGMTKQAAAQLVGELEKGEYVERVPHPTDRRSRLVVLTARGGQVTSAADEAAAATSQHWARELGIARLDQLESDLSRIGAGARLRPVW